MRNIIKRNLVFITVLVAMLALNFQGVAALEGGGFVKREKDIVFNKSYEIFIGNGGVFLDNSRHIGKLVVKAREPVNRGWHQFTQRILDVRVFNEDGKQFDDVYGLVRVYFTLDKYQRAKWEDPASNMSIWTFNEAVGGWSKCVTHLVESSQFTRGRLSCLVHNYGIYGLAWTKPTLVMRLEKAKAEASK